MLSAKHKAALAEAVRLLSEVIENRRDEWNDRSERWQESDKAADHEALTDELQNAVDTLEGIEA